MRTNVPIARSEASLASLDENCKGETVSFRDKLFGNSGSDMAIDLGTANTLVSVLGQGIVINEPSLVVIDQNESRVLAVGAAARDMLGSTSEHVVAVRPLKDGVVADFDVTEAMLRYFMERAQPNHSRLGAKPRVVVCVPSGVTSLEKRAVFEAAITAGARQAFLIEEPMAAAIGAGLPVDNPMGTMIVDIGGGTTEIAVISAGGIVSSTSVRFAGDAFDAAVVQYVKRHFGVAIDERTAEEIKIVIGSAAPLVEEVDVEVRGRDLASGSLRTVRIESEDVRDALEEPVERIFRAIKDTLVETPSDLVNDIVEYGITLTGGGALLRGLDERLRQEIGVPAHVSETALINVVEGCARVLESPDFLDQSYMQQK